MAIENHQLVDIIKRRQGNRTITEFANDLGVYRSTLSEIINGFRPVTGPIAKAMGYKRVSKIVVMFAKKGA